MMSRARTLSPGRQGGRFFRDRGRRASRCPQPSGKTDEMAAMIQILCQYHYIDALKASSAGRYDTPPGPSGDGRKTALARQSPSGAGFRPSRLGQAPFARPDRRTAARPFP